LIPKHLKGANQKEEGLQKTLEWVRLKTMWIRRHVYVYLTRRRRAASVMARGGAYVLLRRLIEVADRSTPPK
jgi:hypothetical protein